MLDALERIGEDFRAGKVSPTLDDEDVHTFIERLLTERLGALGGAASPVICGFLLTHMAPATMFYALSALTAMGGLLCFLSGRRVAKLQNKCTESSLI
ncbi:hypothetical protein HK44_006040 [Pseudomonas fluorescens HK44]|uniref:MFS transporter n=1 Tax=Pseudomonas fluorescens HK44 TaxID=1042209 RepID=A0A010RZE1_PSEFL|nr:hypothetical protein HK44_006040 [Pseudomonas fluorescens HK44]